MKKETAKKFIADNNDALLELGEIIKECKDITNPEYKKIDNNARIVAINLVKKWLYKIFDIAADDIDRYADYNEDNIYQNLKTKEE